eukprot:CAMPEP_0178421214 /NCGR_PEP_ID=MMETSP0689_2-20121128/26533_1 /TAXON_ID=160604 /ORGANISM="Amphidinium massartii, Strain CS-259" /LENGTH=197 /DNA_ID=CAMNT_0020042721 /DNA_START=131 /DNA_END=724 /DNA_ORIENTATION=+
MAWTSSFYGYAHDADTGGHLSHGHDHGGHHDADHEVHDHEDHGHDEGEDHEAHMEHEDHEEMDGEAEPHEAHDQSHNDNDDEVVVEEVEAARGKLLTTALGDGEEVGNRAELMNLAARVIKVVAVTSVMVSATSRLVEARTKDLGMPPWEAWRQEHVAAGMPPPGFPPFARSSEKGSSARTRDLAGNSAAAELRTAF